jgi:PAS domain S-box-containing protein
MNPDPTAQNMMQDDPYFWRILLVDDDRDDYFILKEMLATSRKNSFMLEWVQSFEEAIAAMKNEPYDAVIVDYDLGIQKGTDLIRLASDNDYPAPMILLTGRGSYAIDMEAMQSGAADYLSKSDINPGFLERSIRYAIERTRAQQSLSEANERLGQVVLELSSSEQRFRGTFDNAAVGIAHVGLDGRFLHVNQRLCAITGYPHDDLLQRTFQEITHLEDLEADLAQIERVKRGEITHYSMEKRYIRKNGSSVWVNLTVSGQYDYRGTLLYFIAIIEDIDWRKTVEERLAYQAMILENVHDAIIAAGPDQRITSWNREAEQLYGWTKEEAIGQIYYDLVKPEMMPKDRETLLRFLKNKGARFGEEVHHTRQGRRVIVEFSAIPLWDQSGRIAGFISANRDITDRKKAEEEARAQEVQIRLQRKLLEQRELERLEIARDIHDGPLQELTAASYILAEAMVIDQKEERIAKIETAQRVLVELGRELRMFCNELRPPTLAPFGLERAIRSHIDDFRERFPNIEVIAELAPDKQTLAENTRMALFRIYQEVINNVGKHSNARSVRVTLKLEPSRVMLEIRDNGVGFAIPSDWMAQASSGHLGLIGIRERAAAIDAHLDLDSTPGEGSRVCVTCRIQ